MAETNSLERFKEKSHISQAVVEQKNQADRKYRRKDFKTKGVF